MEWVATFSGLRNNGELARFLILEGYVDDTYYQYTSLFHSGRLSPNDNKYLIQIRAFVTPEPDFTIDNPKEVIAAMRSEDFRQSYILNVNLVDTLLSDRSNYLDQSQKLFEFISSEFESCEEFFDAYYAGGQGVAALLSGLVGAWRGFVPTVLSSSSNISHVTQLVSNLPETMLEKLARDFDELPEFVSVNLPEILMNSPELEPERLACLAFEIKDLAEIKEHPKIVRTMFEKGLFELTLANLEYAYQAILGESDLEPLHERNLTTILSTGNSPLIERVERDFDKYLQEIVLRLEENSKEDAHAILEVIRHRDIDIDELREFLGRQMAQLSSLEDVPDDFHAMLFDKNVIKPTWENCLAFMDSEGFEPDCLINYLDQNMIRAAILAQPIPDDEDSKKLRLFLFSADSMSDAAYQEYVRALPKLIQEIPEKLGPEKTRILIDERKVSFTQENLDWLEDAPSLQVRFVSINVGEYLADPENIVIDDDFREELLRSQIDDPSKIEIIELMDLRSLTGLPERSALIASILEKADAKLSNLNASVAQALITHSEPVALKISLFNRYHSCMTKDEIRCVLDNLPKPFSEIKTGYKRLKLENTDENRELVGWLDSRNIISSWSESGSSSGFIKVNLYRR